MDTSFCSNTRSKHLYQYVELICDMLNWISDTNTEDAVTVKVVGNKFRVEFDENFEGEVLIIKTICNVDKYR